MLPYCFLEDNAHLCTTETNVTGANKMSYNSEDVEKINRIIEVLQLEHCAVCEPMQPPTFNVTLIKG